MRTQKSRKSSQRSRKKPHAGSRFWPGYYDVVIIPPVPVQEHAIGLSRRLHRAGGNWSLGRRAFIPHISLYHIPVRDPDFDAFVEELRSVVSGFRAGHLEITGLEMPVLTVGKPPWLEDLQRKIVRRTFRYLDRDYGVEQTWELDFFSGRRRTLAKRYLKLYGTPMFGMNFRPHITLTTFKGKEAPSNVGLEVKPMRFKVARITVCELGESHSCQKVIAQFPLLGRESI